MTCVGHLNYQVNLTWSRLTYLSSNTLQRSHRIYPSIVTTQTKDQDELSSFGLLPVLVLTLLLLLVTLFTSWAWSWALWLTPHKYRCYLIGCKSCPYVYINPWCAITLLNSINLDFASLLLHPCLWVPQPLWPSPVHSVPRSSSCLYPWLDQLFYYILDIH
jgi:hypothetical protein